MIAASFAAAHQNNVETRRHRPDSGRPALVRLRIERAQAAAPAPGGDARDPAAGRGGRGALQPAPAPDVLPAVAGAGAAAGLQVAPGAAPIAPPPIARRHRHSWDRRSCDRAPATPPAATGPAVSPDFSISLSTGDGASRADSHDRAVRGRRPGRRGRVAAQLHRDRCGLRGARAAGAALGRLGPGRVRCRGGTPRRPAPGGARCRAHEGQHRRRQSGGHGSGERPDPHRCKLPDCARPRVGMAGPAARLRPAQREAAVAGAPRGQRPAGRGHRPGRARLRSRWCLASSSPGTPRCWCPSMATPASFSCRARGCKERATHAWCCSRTRPASCTCGYTTAG